MWSIEAEKIAQVAGIEYDRKIMEKKKQSQISTIENESHLARVTSQADADFYLMQKQAEANQVWMCVCLEASCKQQNAIHFSWLVTKFRTN